LLWFDQASSQWTWIPAGRTNIWNDNWGVARAIAPAKKRTKTGLIKRYDARSRSKKSRCTEECKKANLPLRQGWNQTVLYIPEILAVLFLNKNEK
jgi:hypothetical protein